MRTEDRDEVRYALGGPETEDVAEAFGRIEDGIIGLKAENARLREALEFISQGGGMLSPPPAMANAPAEDWLHHRCTNYERIARAALNQQERKGDDG